MAKFATAAAAQAAKWPHNMAATQQRKSSEKKSEKQKKTWPHILVDSTKLRIYQIVIVSNNFAHISLILLRACNTYWL